MYLTISLAQQTFQLHASGAAYWVEQDTVLLADVHLGKSAHFRKNGMAIPASADDMEYDKLNEVIELFNPSRLWFLGDLFHSYINAEWHFFEQWVRSQTIELALIMGNHDVIGKEIFEKIGVKTYEQLHMGDVILTHHPQEISGKFNIAGHVHPSIKMKGVGRQRVKLPCFFNNEFGLILAAFGDFTGTYTLKPKKGNRIFAIVEQEVMELH
ncbi:ligase-associated DNA damage response endonuclease PdeM [Nonlabens ulvanivorans]|uniref:Phosphoesterase n=1 Tax=Nonlabens ulvanivorans TaxID=906888 RepID=A0A084JTC5_NONUL|nr:ligase-associated DNA damage response endonuclease PdeM [Nonlabens ulvanivorans]KEZ92209.1 metallophosphoesterase [Nonlabens ulvanivorans]PRX15038.1 putative phosphoesterase [Nonlabens ulvanivorans]